MASNNPQIPYVRDGKLHRHDGVVICRVADSFGERTGWYDWLEDPRHKSFAFTANNGAHATCIKERRRGSSGKIHFYWYAYRSIGGVKRRVSLGKGTGITLAKLAQAATRLAQLELAPEGDSVARRSRRKTDPAALPSPKPEAGPFGTPL